MRTLTRTAAVAALVVTTTVLGGCTPQDDPARPTGSTAADAQDPTRDEEATQPDAAAPSSDASNRVPVRSADLASAAVTEPVPPVGVALPTLGVDVPIDPVGVEADGQMEIPPLAERAGWYRFGAAPGEGAGTAVVAAHVDSVASAGLGPFAKLRDLAVGDPVDVTLVDGRVARYAVAGITAVPKPEVTWDDVFTRDGGHRLVLVTCGGTFQRAAGSYTDNVIVTATPVEG